MMFCEFCFVTVTPVFQKNEKWLKMTPQTYKYVSVTRCREGELLVASECVLIPAGLPVGVIVQNEIIVILMWKCSILLLEDWIVQRMKEAT